MTQVVGEEGARAVGRVPREQQPAEEGRVSAALHGSVQLHRSGQHQQLERLQQPQFLLPATEHQLTQLLALSGRRAAHRRLPLGRINGVNQ